MTRAEFNAVIIDMKLNLKQGLDDFAKYQHEANHKAATGLTAMNAKLQLLVEMIAEKTGNTSRIQGKTP